MKDPLGRHGRAGEVYLLRDAAREVDGGLAGQAAGKGLVRAVPLGVGLLDKGAPELIVVPRAQVNQGVVARRQAVVDHNLVPLAKPKDTIRPNFLYFDSPVFIYFYFFIVHTGAPEPEALTSRT